MSVETALDAQFLQIYHQAAAKLAEYRDAGTFAGYVAQMLGYPLLFLDLDFHLIAYGADPKTDIAGSFPSSQYASIFPAQVQSKIKSALLSQRQPYTAVEYNRAQYIITPVASAGSILGFSCLYDHDGNLISTQYPLFQILSPLFGVYFLNHPFNHTPSSASHSDFIHRIMLSESMPGQELLTLCNLYQFDYMALRSCIAIELCQSQKGKAAESWTKLENTAYHIIEEYCQSANLHTYKAVHNGYILVFLMSSINDSPSRARTFALEQADNICASLDQHAISNHIGISDATQGLDTIRACVIQALDALAPGLKLNPAGRIYSYHIDQVYHLLIHCLTHRQATELYRQTIGILKNFDENKSQDLVGTLRQYIHNQLRITETARELFLHRNTLLYRLDKMRELLGEDPREINMCFRLMLGFYISDLLEIDAFHNTGISE